MCVCVCVCVCVSVSKPINNKITKIISASIDTQKYIQVFYMYLFTIQRKLNKYNIIYIETNNKKNLKRSKI